VRERRHLDMVCNQGLQFGAPGGLAGLAGIEVGEPRDIRGADPDRLIRLAGGWQKRMGQKNQHPCRDEMDEGLADKGSEHAVPEGELRHWLMLAG
jgi:hypothetical protein